MVAFTRYITEPHVYRHVTGNFTKKEVRTIVSHKNSREPLAPVHSVVKTTSGHISHIRDLTSHHFQIICVI